MRLTHEVAPLAGGFGDDRSGRELAFLAHAGPLRRFGSLRQFDAQLAFAFHQLLEAVKPTLLRSLQDALADVDEAFLGLVVVLTSNGAALALHRLLRLAGI